MTGHAYAILDTTRLKVGNGRIELVKLRNPWAKAEWTGPWSRTSRMWNQSQDIREREKYYPKSTCERGEFWMAWSDWSERFDILNICYIPDERKGINYRIIGDFNPKLNSPLDLPDMKKYYLRSGS